MQHLFPAPNKNLIGHRGVAGLRPENTLSSFKYAAQLGLNWIEFDVQLSKDNVWVVIHDETLDRTTPARGLVQDYTAQEITALDAGLWFKPPYPDQKIPTLEEVLQLAQQLKLFCNIEVKAEGKDSALYVRQFVEFAVKHKDLLEGTSLLSSFDLNCAINLSATLPHLPVGLLTEQWHPEILDLVHAHNFACLNCNADNLTSASLISAQDKGIPVFLYTVNDPSSAKYWLDQGVNGLFTDRPDLLQDL